VGKGWKGRGGQTSLHGHEARPGVVGAAVAEPGDETACYYRDVCVREGDFVAEVAAGGLPCGLSGFGQRSVGRAVLCSWQSGFGLPFHRRILHHCDSRCRGSIVREKKESKQTYFFLRCRGHRCSGIRDELANN
jgi:hypothetical protein